MSHPIKSQKAAQAKSELFGTRWAALDDAIAGYLARNQHAEMAALHWAFRPAFTRGEINRSLDRLSGRGDVAFVPASGRVMVVLIDAAPLNAGGAA